MAEWKLASLLHRKIPDPFLFPVPQIPQHKFKDFLSHDQRIHHVNRQPKEQPAKKRERDADAPHTGAVEEQAEFRISAAS